MLLTSPKHDAWAALTALGAGTMAWQSTALVVGLLTVWTAMDLLIEWHARRTLVTVARAAPAGLLTIRQDAVRGRVFQLAWGADLDQCRWQLRT